MSESIDYRFFDGKLVTLSLGDDHKPLYVQEGLLMQIPFFEKALRFKNAIQTENSGRRRAKPVDLRDYDPKAAADVIHYVVSGGVPKIKSLEYEIDNEIMFYANTWILADIFGAEKIANTLVDRIIESTKEWLLNPSLIGMLAQKDLEDSRLCAFFIHSIAFCLHNRSYEETIDEMQWTSYATGMRADIDSEKQVFRSICDGLPSHILARILYASQVVHKCPTLKALQDPCTLHKHETTTSCAKRMQKK